MVSPRYNSLMSRMALGVFVLCMNLPLALAQAAGPPSQPASTCRIETTNYKGWSAEQLSNHWLTLEVVPQNGGRLMQVTFAGHPFLFVNPKYEGKYLPPDPSRWFNYGGDKLWLLPEGNDDEQHWPGNSDVLDDGPYAFRKLSEGTDCEIELTSPVDPQTGIQIRRTIRLDADSPRIRFHATMQNKTGHTIEWSMQSVSQYDTADPTDRSRPSRNFFTFAPANPTSTYLNRYHVRFGPAENPEVSVRDDGMFMVHYLHLAAELWLDSTPGWLAVFDGGSHYAMVERFRYEKSEAYPGKASIIFWTNGPELKLNSDGTWALTPADQSDSPFYLEAEINSPQVRLRPGESWDLDTEWFPTRAGDEFHGVEDAGIAMRPLQATRLKDGHIRLAGSFGVFFAGRLVAHFYDERGVGAGTMPVMQVDPANSVELDTQLMPTGKVSRVSIHLEDKNGLDRGSLGEVRVDAAENH
ncbi:MAG TPA: hypothetical protein VFO39_04040 [Candidatus Sulfotelmatobacter sp.]|nr:hypothetical protein [Candidatus Sulfotelmatobacter sp.]